MYHIKELAAEEINLIGSALAKFPYEQVHKLIAKIKEQVEKVEAEIKAQADSKVSADSPQPDQNAPTEQAPPA